MSIVIPDLHGRLADLEWVLAMFPDEQYVFLGDLIDRGTDSPGVVKKVRELVKDGRAQLILGNHEWMALGALKEVAAGEPGFASDIWLMNGGIDTFNQYKGDPKRLGDDLSWIVGNAQHWIIQDGGLFTHAHRLPAHVLAHEASRPLLSPEHEETAEVLQGSQDHLWNRPGDPGAMHALPEGVDYSVHGHTPQKNGRPLKLTDEQGKPAFFIDLGAVFGLGRFAVWNTVTREATSFDVRK